MKKTYSPLPKQVACFIAVLLLLTANSCIKGNKQVIFPKNDFSGSVTDILLQRMADKDKVHPSDISGWLNSHFPAANLPILKMDKAQQNVIEGKHVIRIPIAANSALFFTKNNGQLLAYINQWADKAPGQKQFTGSIVSWSFQTNTLMASMYNHSVITNSKYYKTPAAPLAARGTGLKINGDTASDNPFFTFFEKMLCLLQGGKYISQSDIDNGSAYGANGNPGQTGCDLGAGSSSDDDYPTTLPDFGPVFGMPDITVTDLGAYGAYGAGYGNNYIWVTTYIPPSGNCLPSAGEGFNQDVPTDGDCIYGHWIAAQTDIPENELDTNDSMSSNDTDVDTDNNEDGNFDNDTYVEYQQSTSWPTVENVLSGHTFIGWHTGANCLELSKQQIAQLGYSISNYGASGQTIQTYTEAHGADSSSVKKAITYINTALSQGKPVIIGVDVKPGQASPPYTDNSTDHFVVIVGSGTDNNGRYYRFYDNSTNNPIYGASVNNKLYYNPTTKLISGNTTSAYDNAITQSSSVGIQHGLHPFIITQVRKLKK